MTAIRLTTDQQNARNELLLALGMAAPADCPWIAMFGPPGSGKTTLLQSLSAANAITASGMKIALATLDAAQLPGYLLPWQHLLSVVLDRLSDQALPSEQSVLSSLRAELLSAVQATVNQSAEAAEIMLGNFAKHFRNAFPSLVRSVMGAANNILLIGLDHIDKVSPATAGELFEAAGYFLRADGARLLVAADEKLLSDRLGADAMPTAWAAKIEIGKWMTLASTGSADGAPTRVSGASIAPIARAAPPMSNEWLLDQTVQFGPLMSVGLGVLFVDQLTKIIMRGVAQRSVLGSWLQLGVAPLTEPPSAIGLVLPVLVELIALALSCLLMALAVGEHSAKHTPAARLQQYGLALVIGALLSNLLDRAVAGGVLNFIQAGSLPIFNLAHLALASGAALVGFSAWRGR